MITFSTSLAWEDEDDGDCTQIDLHACLPPLNFLDIIYSLIKVPLILDAQAGLKVALPFHCAVGDLQPFVQDGKPLRQLFGGDDQGWDDQDDVPMGV